MRLLVVAPAPLGDTLFITPALSALRRGFREAEIDVLAAEESAEILRGNENIDSLITVRGISSFVYKILSLRSVKYNLAAGLSRTGSLFLPLVRADKKAGFMNSVATDSG
ncbi:MAG: glycosyltransferase family 9 protein, partial [Bacillota bacterium]